MEDKIKIFLEKEAGRQILNFDANLIDGGFLDSFLVIKLIAFLEKEFDVEFNMENLSHENFNSVSSISAFVANLKNNGNKTG